MSDPFDLERFVTAQEPVFDSVIGDNGARGELRICPFAVEAHRRPAALMRRFRRHYCGNFRFFSAPGARQSSLR